LRWPRPQWEQQRLPGSRFVVGFLTYGMGLVNMPGIEITVLIGILLIVAIALPLIIRKLMPVWRRST
jgi:hypothetical protein